jgi:membrane protein
VSVLDRFHRLGRRIGDIDLVRCLGAAAAAFVRHEGFTLAAALAFYVTLAFAPAVVLGLWAAASVGRNAQERFLGELDVLAGNDVRAAAQIIIDHAQTEPSIGTLAGLLGIVFLLVSASAVFAQLQATLNLIWHITPRKSALVLQWLQHRLLSIGMLAASIFILLVTLVVSALLGWALGQFDAIWQVLNQLIALAVYTTIFTALFRYLPDERTPLRHAWSGGFSTAALFMLGKFLIGQYLAHSNTGDAYGPAGAFIVLLVWVYYSALVFYFGAEIVGQQRSGIGDRRSGKSERLDVASKSSPICDL